MCLSTELLLSTEIYSISNSPRVETSSGPTRVFDNGGLLWKVRLYASKIVKCGDKI